MHCLLENGLYSTEFNLSISHKTFCMHRSDYWWWQVKLLLHTAIHFWPPKWKPQWISHSTYSLAVLLKQKWNNSISHFTLMQLFSGTFCMLLPPKKTWGPFCISRRFPDICCSRFLCIAGGNIDLVEEALTQDRSNHVKLVSHHKMSYLLLTA